MPAGGGGRGGTGAFAAAAGARCGECARVRSANRAAVQGALEAGLGAAADDWADRGGSDGFGECLWPGGWAGWAGGEYYSESIGGTWGYYPGRFWAHLELEL